MTTDLNQRRYLIIFSGDAIEAVVAPIDGSVADYWLTQPAQNLFDATHPLDDTPFPNVPEAMQLPDWREFERAIHLEGVEMHNGVVEVRDEEGEIVHSDSTDGEDYWDARVGTFKQFEISNSFQSTEPVFVGITSYTGSIEYSLETDDEFDRDALMLVVGQVEGTTPFITKVLYRGEELTADGSGRFLWQSSGIYVEDKPPLLHTAEPEKI